MEVVEIRFNVPLSAFSFSEYQWPLVSCSLEIWEQTSPLQWARVKKKKEKKNWSRTWIGINILLKSLPRWVFPLELLPRSFSKQNRQQTKMADFKLLLWYWTLWVTSPKASQGMLGDKFWSLTFLPVFHTGISVRADRAQLFSRLRRSCFHIWIRHHWNPPFCLGKTLVVGCWLGSLRVTQSRCKSTKWTKNLYEWNAPASQVAGSVKLWWESLDCLLEGATFTTTGIKALSFNSQSYLTLIY